MSRIITPTSPRKDTFLTLRVTQEFRDALSVVAEQSLRSVSSQAFYYIQLGMQAEAREAREKALQELQNLTGAD